MSKIKTTANTYKPVVLQRAILICWGLLFVCFAIKIFGGNYFEIVVNSPKFVEICTYLDSNIFIYGAIGLASSLVSFWFYYLAILRKLKFSNKELIIYFATVVVVSVVKIICIKINLSALSFVADAFLLFIAPFLFDFAKTKRNFVRVLIAFGLNLLFQIIALVTKNIGVKITVESSLTTIIFMIDLYIMLALYYLYSNIKKGERI